MSSSVAKLRCAIAVLVVAVTTACNTDSAPTVTAPSDPLAAPDRASMSAVKFWEVGSSVRWNRRAVALFRARGGRSGPIFAYLSLAQYRAVLAAEDGKSGRVHPSAAAAAAGASFVVLKRYYPADTAILEADLAAQRAETPWPGEQNRDFAAGEAIGRAIGAAVLAFAATDNFGLVNPGSPPVGPGYWRSAAPSIVRGGFGARPFFLTSNTELISPPPPSFGSATFLNQLAEVRTVSDNRTAAQVAIARKWAPFGNVVYNEVAGELIVKHRIKELEAARIYAYANTASFDAIIACFHSKFTYWYIRPSQADSSITLPIGLPNHPSYPSAHSCDNGAWQTFPPMLSRAKRP